MNEKQQKIFFEIDELIRTAFSDYYIDTDAPDKTIYIGSEINDDVFDVLQRLLNTIDCYLIKLHFVEKINSNEKLYKDDFDNYYIADLYTVTPIENHSIYSLN